MGLEHVAIDTNNFDGEVNFSLLIGLLLGAAPGVWNAAAEKNFSRYKGVLSTISTDGSIPEVLSELVFLMANL